MNRQRRRRSERRGPLGAAAPIDGLLIAVSEPGNPARPAQPPSGWSVDRPCVWCGRYELVPEMDCELVVICPDCWLWYQTAPVKDTVFFSEVLFNAISGTRQP